MAESLRSFESSLNKIQEIEDGIASPSYLGLGHYWSTDNGNLFVFDVAVDLASTTPGHIIADPLFANGAAYQIAAVIDLAMSLYLEHPVNLLRMAKEESFSFITKSEYYDKPLFFLPTIYPVEARRLATAIMASADTLNSLVHRGERKIVKPIHPEHKNACKEVAFHLLGDLTGKDPEVFNFLHYHLGSLIDTVVKYVQEK